MNPPVGTPEKKGLWRGPWPLVLLALLPIIPIWGFEYLPLQDFPNHMARLEIFSAYERSGFYSETYSAGLPEGVPPPNISLDLFVGAIAGLLGVEPAMRLFLTLYVALFITALYLLSRALIKDFTMLLLFNLPVMYSYYFFDGVLNFLMSIPLFLLAVYFLEKYRALRWKALAAAALLMAVIYFTHLFAFFAFAIFVLIWLFIEKPGGRAALLMSMVFLPLAVVGALFAFNINTGEETFSLRLKLLYGGFMFLHLPYKQLIAASALYVFAFYAAFRGGVSIKKTYLTSAGALFISYLLLPHGSQAIDVRAVPFALVLLTLALDARLPTTGAPDAKTSGGRTVSRFALLGVYGIGLVWMLGSFADFNKEFSTECVKQIKGGSAVFPVDATEPESLITPYAHAWGYFLKEKEMRVPYLFTGPSLRDKRPLPAPAMQWAVGENFSGRVAYDPPLAESLRTIAGSYDYVLLMGTAEGAWFTGFAKICSAGIISLYEVGKPAQPAP